MSTWPAFDSPPWQKQFGEWEGRYRQLADEVVHALEHKLTDAGIAVHAISSRVKSRDSIEGKLRRSGAPNGITYLFDTQPLYHYGLKDVVGVRVVCMFFSQIEQIVELAQRTFHVIEVDRKTNGADVASFGYMSDHLVCQLGGDFRGPRYDSVQGVAFELQVRTIAMDAWAAVSHHLDYKSEFGIPAELKRDFHALSGLFYVADTHFEMFSKQVSKFRGHLGELGVPVQEQPVPLNQDVIRTYLLKTFPDREEADTESVDEFLAELLEAQYQSIQHVDREIQRGLPALLIAEREKPPSDGDDFEDEARFTSVGAARGALDLVNENFRRLRTQGNPLYSYAEYRRFVKPA